MEYYNGTKKVIAVTELMNIFFTSVEKSFQMIIDSCVFNRVTGTQSRIKSLKAIQAKPQSMTEKCHTVVSNGLL